MTEVIRRRRPRVEGDQGSQPGQPLGRFSCPACITEFYSSLATDHCSICGLEASPIAPYGPVPGKICDPNAKRVVVTSRLPRVLADKLDMVRGAIPRSEWIRGCVQEAVAATAGLTQDDIIARYEEPLSDS